MQLREKKQAVYTAEPREKLQQDLLFDLVKTLNQPVHPTLVSLSHEASAPIFGALPRCIIITMNLKNKPA